MTIEEVAKDLDDAVRTLLVAVKPDPGLPDWQCQAYLKMVAIPRAEAAARAYALSKVL